MTELCHGGKPWEEITIAVAVADTAHRTGLAGVPRPADLAAELRNSTAPGSPMPPTERIAVSTPLRPN